MIRRGLDPKRELAKAHLIAADFGGSGTNTKNLVSTWSRAVNLSTMKVIEGRVTKAVEKQGQIVSYSVVPLYAGDRLQPWAIVYSAYGVYPDGRPGIVIPAVPLLNAQVVDGRPINLGLR
jgi:hypothetical protein